MSQGWVEAEDTGEVKVQVLQSKGKDNNTTGPKPVVSGFSTMASVQGKADLVPTKAGCRLTSFKGGARFPFLSHTPFLLVEAKAACQPTASSYYVWYLCWQTRVVDLVFLGRMSQDSPDLSCSPSQGLHSRYDLRNLALRFKEGLETSAFHHSSEILLLSEYLTKLTVKAEKGPLSSPASKDPKHTPLVSWQESMWLLTTA